MSKKSEDSSYWESMARSDLGRIFKISSAGGAAASLVATAGVYTVGGSADLASVSPGVLAYFGFCVALSSFTPLAAARAFARSESMQKKFGYDINFSRPDGQ